MTVSILQFQRDGDRLMVSLMRGSQRFDGRPFDDTALLESWSRSYLDLMERALAFPLNDHRSVLVDFGRCLHDNLLTGPLAEALRDPALETIVVDLPESLLWLPVEGMHDGESFLGTRFALGRRITSWEGSRPTPSVARRDGHAKPAFLLVAGHAEDPAFFDETRGEIYGLCDMLTEADAFEVRELLVDNSLRKTDLLRNLSASDFVHFSGHSDGAANGRAGWLFEDFRFTPEDVEHLQGCDPYFVFSNSCRSSSVTNWRELRDMVRAFWQRGTQHFIGANTRVHYKRAAEFADAFYRSFLGGASIGAAVRAARRAVFDNPTHYDPCWLSYVLYGDPEFALRDTLTDGEAGKTGAKPAASGGRRPVEAAAARPGFAICGWSGREVPASTAALCCEPNCTARVGMDGQLAQRRALLDLAMHEGGLQGGLAAARQFFCREHLPAALADWMDRGAAANKRRTAGADTCAWTGRRADRSELMKGLFRETPHGLMSPEAQKRYICADSGTVIPPEDARAERGFIVYRGRTLGEEAYWKALGVTKRPLIDEIAARAAESAAREAMAARLSKLDSVPYEGRDWSDVRLSAPLEEGDVYWKAMLEASGGLLRAPLRVGIVQRAVRHEDHLRRFGADRQPADLQDLERAGRDLRPLEGAQVTLGILSSPTGWTTAAREHVRKLEPGEVVVFLKTVGGATEPLAFNDSAPIARALKFELAGGLALV